MSKKRHDLPPPGKVDELLTRIEELERKVALAEEIQAALVGAVNAFIVVYGVRRLPTPPAESGDGTRREPL
jgi:hypothetical protein